MRNLILAITVGMGTYAVLISWVVVEKRKNRQERQDMAKARRARALLRLSDEIQVIQEPKAPPELAELEANCRRFKESMIQIGVTAAPHFEKFKEAMEEKTAVV